MPSKSFVSKGETTRGFILDRAVDMVRVGGLESLSIGGVAAAVGMSKSGVFAHFGSLEELQLAALTAAARAFSTEVFVPALRAPRGLARLQAIVSTWLEWLCSAKGGCPLLSAAIEYDDRPGPIHDRIVMFERRLRHELLRAVRLAKTTGELRTDADPAQIAFELFGIALATHHDHRLFNDKNTRQRCSRALTRLLDDYRSAAT